MNNVTEPTCQQRNERANAHANLMDTITTVPPPSPTASFRQMIKSLIIPFALHLDLVSENQLACSQAFSASWMTFDVVCTFFQLKTLRCRLSKDRTN
mmetsp:Transcript_28647/g.53683  ORF Transcript_28647/g.53683 Transcript_28647/m.53683 type:complete len:97 (+) Transcript_28647:206-496(+)